LVGETDVLAGRRAMSKIEVDRATCTKCAICVEVCPREFLRTDADGFPEAMVGVKPGCNDCGHCLSVCPQGALALNGMSDRECEGVEWAQPLSLKTVEHLVKGRRSVRAFRERPVPRQTIEWLLDAARWAPSAMNAQPVCWIVIDGREKVRALGGLTADWMRAEGRFPELVGAWDRGVDRVFRGAPHLLVAHAFHEGFDLTVGGAVPDSALGNPMVDCAIAVATVEIAAHAVGVGACWAGFFMLAARADAPFLDSLDLPDGHEVFAALMLGLPRYHHRLIPPRRESRVTWM
jgi:nitroreductase/ferredoxin